MLLWLLVCYYFVPLKTLLTRTFSAILGSIGWPMWDRREARSSGATRNCGAHRPGWTSRTSKFGSKRDFHPSTNIFLSQLITHQKPCRRYSYTTIAVEHTHLWFGAHSISHCLTAVVPCSASHPPPQPQPPSFLSLYIYCNKNFIWIKIISVT